MGAVQRHERDQLSIFEWLPMASGRPLVVRIAESTVAHVTHMPQVLNSSSLVRAETLKPKTLVNGMFTGVWKAELCGASC
jgi:hypothetical protein